MGALQTVEKLRIEIVRCDGGRERSGLGRAQRRDFDRKQEGDELGARMFGLDRAFPAGLCFNFKGD